MIAKIADQPPLPTAELNFGKRRCCVCNLLIDPVEPFTFGRPFNYLTDGTVAHSDCYRSYWSEHHA